MDFQALIDAQSKAWELERAQSQMTLGELISTLKAMDQDDEITGLSLDVDSYRGYYSDLAFEPSRNTYPVYKLLEVAEASLGHTYEGYKGGDFTMTKITPLWVAHYGSCGQKLMGITKDGNVELEVEE